MANPAAFSKETAKLESLLAARPLIRTLNFHNTPRSRLDEYDRQLAACSLAFSSVDQDELDGYMTTGRWAKAKPGLIVAFYNGYRNNYDVLKPLLERYGLVGWFFVVTGFVDVRPDRQTAFAAEHGIRTLAGEYGDERRALSWSELNELDRSHVIASHTRTHSPLAGHNPVALEAEILGSQQDLETRLGHPVRSFASFSGMPVGESGEADEFVKAAGYQFVFSNFKIQRLHANSASPQWIK